jgi:hypothetical protein
MLYPDPDECGSAILIFIIFVDKTFSIRKEIPVFRKKRLNLSVKSIQCSQRFNRVSSLSVKIQFHFWLGEIPSNLYPFLVVVGGGGGG